MSSIPTEPTPSPVPKRSSSLEDLQEQNQPADSIDVDSAGETSHALRNMRDQIALLEQKSTELERSLPHPKPKFPESRLRLKILDLSHPGSASYLVNSNPCTALEKAAETVLSTLYSPSKTNDHIPPTKSVTLILKSMGGVAYTTGADSDDNDKKIYLSVDYVQEMGKRLTQPGQLGAEIHGVLVHEMVHCWQWNGSGTAPGGLIEGIADFVRLKAGLSPPHWRRGGDKWDAGYQHTAYFLEWIENSRGDGSVRRVNGSLQEHSYEEEEFWKRLFGTDVADLWDEYLKTLPKKDDSCSGEPEASSPGKVQEGS